LDVSSVKSGDSALLIVADGSTVNPDSSAPTLAHAAEIRRRKVFADVECAFWKEEPSLRDALFLFDPESVREVRVVPNFISEGYFTQTVVPRELELNGWVTKRLNGQLWGCCEPVGNHLSRDFFRNASTWRNFRSHRLLIWAGTARSVRSRLSGRAGHLSWSSLLFGHGADVA
jgi:CbiX